MSKSYTDMLRANYENMHTDMLIEIKLKGNLTEAAEKILNEELQKRRISKNEFIEYVESDLLNFKPDDFHADIKIGDLASTGSRYVAQFLDQIIALALIYLMVFIVPTPDVSANVKAIAGISIYALYILFNDAMPNGQSVGKKILSIKVINKTTGKNCGLPESFLRNITTVIPFLAVIDAFMIFSLKKQRMGDKIANTLVIKNKNLSILPC